MKKCKSANKYKAIYPPSCNNGKPCDACKKKWENRTIKQTYEVSKEHLKDGEPIPIKLLTPESLAGTIYYYEGFHFQPDFDTVEKDQDVDLSFSYEFVENPHNIEYQQCNEFEEHISLILIDILKDRAAKVIEEQNGNTTSNIEEPVSE